MLKISATRKKSKRGKTLKVVAISGIALVSIIMVVWALSPKAPIPANATTFTLIDYGSGEDVSDFGEISVWTPKSTYEGGFAEAEDIYTLTNFEETKKAEHADDVSIDLSGIAYAWVEINPEGDQLWANTFYLISGGSNNPMQLDAYHLSSDVNINILNRTDCEQIWLPASLTVNNTIDNSGNYTVHLDVPNLSGSVNVTHVGDDWDFDDDDWDSATVTQKRKYWDERYWRCQAPTYSPLIDTEKEFSEPLERITNAFDIRFSFNTTVNVTDGCTTQVNLTIMDENYANVEPIKIVNDGQNIHLIFTGAITFTKAGYNFDIQLQHGANIRLNNVETGRIITPREEDSLGAFTAYSSIRA